MKKEEFIKRYGNDVWSQNLRRERERARAHKEERRGSNQLWRLNNPNKAKARDNEHNRKGGKYYEQRLKYQSTGTPHERNIVRQRHGYYYRPYKQIIAPESVLHHEWIPETANYRGVALVEKDQHQYGFIDVIQILEGEITLLTEEEIAIVKEV